MELMSQMVMVAYKLLRIPRSVIYLPLQVRLEALQWISVLYLVKSYVTSAIRYSIDFLEVFSPKTET